MTELRGFKFMTTLVLKFWKIRRWWRNKIYLNSKAEVNFNESDIDDVFESIYSTIISNIKKSLGKGCGWIIHSNVNHIISFAKYNLLCHGSYIKLPKELDHSRKGLIHILNIDNHQRFKWCLVRYSHHGNHNPRRIR